jgi:beta-lactamase class D
MSLLFSESSVEAKPSDDAILGGETNGTGVDDDDIGLGWFVGFLVTGVLKELSKTFSLTNIHLASVIFDQKFWHGFLALG